MDGKNFNVLQSKAKKKMTMENESLYSASYFVSNQKKNIHPIINVDIYVRLVHCNKILLVRLIIYYLQLVFHKSFELCLQFCNIA